MHPLQALVLQRLHVQCTSTHPKKHKCLTNNYNYNNHNNNNHNLIISYTGEAAVLQSIWSSRPWFEIKNISKHF